MGKLTITDIRNVVARLPQDVRDALKYRSRVCVGGGFVRDTIANMEVSDIDLFSPDDKTHDSLLHIFMKRSDAKTYTTENATTILTPGKLPIQLIKRWMYKFPEMVIQSFDFTVCQAVIWYQTNEWQSRCSNEFYSDLAGRNLVYTHPMRNEDAGGSMLRIQKFLHRGYRIQAPSIAGVVARLISGMKVETLTSEEERTKEILRLLREVDPLQIVDGVEVVDDHMVM